MQSCGCPHLHTVLLRKTGKTCRHYTYNGLNNVSDMAHILLSNDEIEVYFKLYILLCAFDTVVSVESVEKIQAALNAMIFVVKIVGSRGQPNQT